MDNITPVKGTYTGSISDGSTIVLNVTQVKDPDSYSGWQDKSIPNWKSFTIRNDSFSLKF